MRDHNRLISVEMTVLSPVFIGGGEGAEWSPYGDFVQSGKRIELIDQKKLQLALEQHPEKIQEYVSGIREGFDNNRSDFSLERFIRKSLGMDLHEISQTSMPVEGNLGRNVIRRFISSAGRPFIPGSSVKGAIRTAILLDWIQTDPKGKQFLGILRRLLQGAGRRRFTSEFVYMNDREKRFDLEKACFGDIRNDVLRNLGISDTSCIDQSLMSIEEMRRVFVSPPSRHGQRRSDIPMWSQVVSVGAMIAFRMALRQPVVQTGFSFLDCQSPENLFSIINSQSKGVIELELAELGDDSPRELSAYIAFYEGLEAEFRHLSGNESILRLGGGKTWYDNSIGLAVDNEDFDPEDMLFLSMLRFLGLRSRRPFPSTRSAIMKNGLPALPPGWVKLRF
jgi:CRISPR-associated protein Csm5